MPPLDFPNTPTNGQTYTSGGVVWTYNSTVGVWKITSAGVIGPTGFTGSLGFTGSSGFTGSASTVQGPNGFTGSVGFTGSASTVAGFTGSIGFTGSLGFTGSGYGTTASAQMGSLGIGTPASGVTGEIRATNNITAYYSDDRLKTKLFNIPNALEKVLSLNGFYFRPNEVAQSLGYKDIIEVGISAQEIEAVLPQIVVPAPIDEQYKTVRYEKMIPLLIEAIKQQQQEISELKRRINNLTGDLK